MVNIRLKKLNTRIFSLTVTTWWLSHRPLSDDFNRAGRIISICLHLWLGWPHETINFNVPARLKILGNNDLVRVVVWLNLLPAWELMYVFFCHCHHGVCMVYFLCYNIEMAENMSRILLCFWFRHFVSVLILTVRSGFLFFKFFT